VESRVAASKCKPWFSRKISQLRENKTKVEEVFVYQKAIDVTTYQEMRPKLVEDLTLAEMELREAQTEEIEIDCPRLRRDGFNERFEPLG
jgi:hypothetical protein